MLYSLILVLHILISLILCVVVLLQSSKGGGLAGAFGGGGGAPQQIFGSRGMTSLLHKATIWCAAGFFLTSSLLFLLTGTRNAGPQTVGDALREGAVADVTPPVTAPATGEFALPAAESDQTTDGDATDATTQPPPDDDGQ